MSVRFSQSSVKVSEQVTKSMLGIPPHCCQVVEGYPRKKLQSSWFHIDLVELCQGAVGEGDNSPMLNCIWLLKIYSGKDTVWKLMKAIPTKSYTTNNQPHSITLKILNKQKTSRVHLLSIASNYHKPHHSMLKSHTHHMRAYMI